MQIGRALPATLDLLPKPPLLWFPVGLGSAAEGPGWGSPCREPCPSGCTATLWMLPQAAPALPWPWVMGSDPAPWQPWGPGRGQAGAQAGGTGAPAGDSSLRVTCGDELADGDWNCLSPVLLGNRDGMVYLEAQLGLAGSGLPASRAHSHDSVAALLPWQEPVIPEIILLARPTRRKLNYLN